MVSAIFGVDVSKSDAYFASTARRSVRSSLADEICCVRSSMMDDNDADGAGEIVVPLLLEEFIDRVIDAKEDAEGS